MKCPHCGGEVGLEEKFCPWCGKPNEQSVQHMEDMARFQASYRATEQSVEKKTKHVVRLLPRLIVILALLIVSVVSVIIGSQAWEFSETVRKNAAERSAAATRAALDTYLEQKDYRGFHSYAEYHCLSFYRGPFDDYSQLDYCISDYVRFLDRLEDVFLVRDREKWLKNDAEFDIRYLAMYIDDLFDQLDDVSKHDLTEKDKLIVQDIRATAQGMVRVFLGLDEEALKEFLALSENRQPAMLEEVLTGA